MNTNEKDFNRNREDNIIFLQSIPLKRMQYNPQAPNYQQYQAIPAQTPKYQPRVVQFKSPNIQSPYSQQPHNMKSPVQPQEPLWAQRPVEPRRTQNMQRPVQPQEPLWAQKPVEPRRTQNMQRPVQPQEPLWAQKPVKPRRTQNMQATVQPQPPLWAQQPVAPITIRNYRDLPTGYSTTQENRTKMRTIARALEDARKYMRVVKDVVREHKAKGKKVNEQFLNETVKKCLKRLGVLAIIGTIGFVISNEVSKDKEEKVYPVANNPAEFEQMKDEIKYEVTGLGDVTAMTEELSVEQVADTTSVSQETEYETGNNVYEEQTEKEQKINDGSISYWLDELPPDLVKDIAEAIREGNENIPNQLYSTNKVYEKESDYDLVKEYFERLDGAKWNPNKVNTVVYQAPDVLLAMIKYYYAQEKNGNKDNITVYYRETQGVVNIATAQERRRENDPKPKKHHTADTRNKRQTNIDDVLLVYATLDNIAGANKKLSFIEMGDSSLVYSYVNKMIFSLPELLEDIVENDRNQDFDER